MRRVIRSGGISVNKGEILDTFFGLDGEALPENLRELHSQYLREVNKKGGCSSCRKNAVQKRFRQAVLDLI
jgi:uncharacterized membrane protein